MVALLNMDEWTNSCLSPFTTCSERRDTERTETKEEKNKSSWSNRCLSPIFKVLTRYRPNTHYLIIQGRYSVPEKDVHRWRQDVGGKGRGRESDNSIDSTPLSMLHPRTWSFPLLIGKADELFASQLSQFRELLCTEAADAHATHPARPHGWAQSGRPMGGKGVCGFFRAGCREQRIGGAGRHESEIHPTHKHLPRPPPAPGWKKKFKKISSCLTLVRLLPPGFCPACIHLVFVDNQSAAAAAWLHWYLARIFFIIQLFAPSLFFFPPLFFSTACLTVWFDK